MGTVLKLVSKYGAQAVTWVWNNSQRVIAMLARMSPQEVATVIAQMFS